MSIEEMTIDETIDGLRDQMGFGNPVLINAIRHLKAYKENKPLTWENLKSMEGKPVWVEEIEDYKILFGQWDIISGFGYSENFDLIDYENPIIDFYISGNRTKFGLGKTWQAYRKERK